MTYNRPYITEISETDFRKLNLNGFRNCTEHILENNGGYSQNTIRIISLNDVLDDIRKSIRNNDKYPKLILVALHKDNDNYSFYESEPYPTTTESFYVCAGVCDILYRKDRRIIKYRTVNSRYIQKLAIPYSETESIYLVHLL